MTSYLVWAQQISKTLDGHDAYPSGWLGVVSRNPAQLGGRGGVGEFNGMLYNDEIGNHSVAWLYLFWSAPRAGWQFEIAVSIETGK